MSGILQCWEAPVWSCVLREVLVTRKVKSIAQTGCMQAYVQVLQVVHRYRPLALHVDGRFR